MRGASDGKEPTIVDPPEGDPILARIEKSSVLRPSIPPALLLTLALWASAAGAYTALREADETFLMPWCVLGAIFSSACVVRMLLRRSGYAAALICLGLAAGLTLGGFGALKQHRASAAAEGFSGKAIAVLASDAKPSYGVYVATAEVHTDAGLSHRVRLTFPQSCDLLYGDAIACDVTLKAPSGNRAAYWWQTGIDARATLGSWEEVEGGSIFASMRSVRRELIGMLDAYAPENAGLLKALVCGYRNDIESDGVYEEFKAAGLAHLVAVSGAHLSLLVLLVSFFASKLPVPRAVHAVICMAFIGMYLLLSGMPISALRAAFMAALSLSSLFFRRRSSSISALSLCIALFLIVDPQLAVSVSFFLSAASTLSIVIFAGLISSWMPTFGMKGAELISAPLSLTFASGIATIPFSAALFSVIAVVSPLSNIVAAPLFTLACFSGLAAGFVSSLFPTLAPFVCRLADAAAEPLHTSVRLLTCIPYGRIPADVDTVAALAFSATLCIVLWRIWPRIRPGALIGAAAASVICLCIVIGVAPRFASDEIIMLDVGQGDAFVIRSKGAAVLVDTGNQDTMLLEALARHGIYRLDCVMISHKDDDHCGSLDALMNAVEVDSVALAEGSRDCSCSSCGALRDTAALLCGGDVRYLRPYDALKVGTFQITVIWPFAFSDEGGNADSLCFTLDRDTDGNGIHDEGECRALFVGDAESEQLHAMMDHGDVGKIDILKVGHHGSRVSLDAETSAALSPSVALIGVGAGNTYGHPTEETLSFLEATDTKVYRSDTDGDVVVRMSDTAISVIP